VVGSAHEDPGFTGGSASVRYSIQSSSPGPFQVKAELWYQPIGFRWAHNLEPYKAIEPQRFVSYYEADSRKTAVVLAEASSTF